MKPSSSFGNGILWFAVLICCTLGGNGQAAAPSGPTAKEFSSGRTVFLGDSITYGGEYIALVETALRLHHPKADFDFINLGLPSETVSGLTEPGHAGGAFPRPVLGERLGRALAKTKPRLLVACYGMNDGIYYPFSEERFKSFQHGIEEVRSAASSAGARVLHLTPPTFDPVPLRGQTLPAGLDAYPKPFEGYNGVLDRYSGWLLQKRADGWWVWDIHGPMNRFLETQRAKEPEFKLAADGVHAGSQGNWVMARAILMNLQIPESELTPKGPSKLWERFPNGKKLLELVLRRQNVLRDAWLSDVGHRRPGMAKGKPVEEAAREGDALLLEIRRLQQP